MKKTEVIRKLRLYVLVCATVCFVIALIFPNIACRETLIDASISMLLAIQLAMYIVEGRGMKDGGEENDG